MSIFSKILSIALSLALANVFASETIYDRDFVRGYVGFKGDFRSMKSTGVKFINTATGINGSYKKEYVDTHVEIGAEYSQLQTWFDVDFMPLTPEREGTEWYAYGLTWMWGYKLFPASSKANVIPSLGAGFELLNIRANQFDRVLSCVGPTLNMEIELRLQASQLSVGVYGGYKVVRHDGWDELSKAVGIVDPFGGNPYSGDVNADKGFVGARVSWTMLSEYQKRERETSDSQLQEGDSKFGVRAGYGMYKFSSGDKNADKLIDMGMVGFGGGLVAKVPLASKLSLNPELNFYYRNLASYKAPPPGKGKSYYSELTLGIIPVILQFAPFERVPIFLAAGFQLDIPISPEMIDDKVFGSDSEDVDNRQSIDFGIPVGLGYMVTPNFGVDFRYVLGLTHLLKDESRQDPENPGKDIKIKDKSSLMQFGLGLTYLF